MQKTKEDLRDESYEEKIEPIQRPEAPKPAIQEEDMKNLGFKKETSETANM